jgi:ABC-2 type transport system permease protein
VASPPWAAGWGDLASGLLLIALSGHASPASLPRVAVAVLASAALFTSTAILVHSAAFWLGRVHALARQLCEFLITFSSYPEPLFAGALKLLLFTALPAGFIGYLPASLVREFSWTTLGAVAASVALYGALAGWVFRAGLRRYASGSRFGVRA